jgi:predicted MPP superfamily phosphohydrolase
MSPPPPQIEDAEVPPTPAKDRPRVTRRRWLKRAAAATLAVGAGVALDAFWIEPHRVEIVGRDLPLSNLPAGWHGRTLMQISDVHVGTRVSGDYLIQAFDQAASLVPDVVVVTGDFVSCSRAGILPAEQAQRVYAFLPQGRVATLGVLGNHDYGWSWRDVAIAADVQQIMQDCGLRMLRNESVNLEGLKIAGVEDLWSGRCDGNAALGAAMGRGAHVALCHNPDAVDLDQWPDFQGWILSGHTHGGQCKPPFLPPPVLPVVNHRYTAGEFDLYDGRRLYINRGLGHSFPVRFNCRPEITLFRLVDA